MSNEPISGGAPAEPRPKEPDAHGQAALLLAESMLHVLVESGTLTLDQAIDAVETAGEVKIDLALDLGESRRRMEESLGLLARIRLSLAATDIGPTLSPLS